MLYLLFCIGVWSLVFSFLGINIVKGLLQAISHVEKLHKIPCSKCMYCTGDYRLKCTVNPSKALSEEAIDCLDFESSSIYKPVTTNYLDIAKFSKS